MNMIPPGVDCRSCAKCDKIILSGEACAEIIGTDDVLCETCEPADPDFTAHDPERFMLDSDFAEAEAAAREV
jgi:hypothetical protein